MNSVFIIDCSQLNTLKTCVLESYHLYMCLFNNSVLLVLFNICIFVGVCTCHSLAMYGGILTFCSYIHMYMLFYRQMNIVLE